jgi:hypothetical protein
MNPQRPPHPPGAGELGFPEARARLLEVAAFLDRTERHSADGDYRVRALREAAAILSDGAPARARRILESLSDPTLEPLEKTNARPAAGAWRRD